MTLPANQCHSERSEESAFSEGGLRISRITEAITKKAAPLGFGGSSVIPKEFAFSLPRRTKSQIKIAHQKNRGPAWDRGPWKARSVAGVVFTPARGVIHPSFPLRGRWERPLKSTKQAPSPSLATLQTAVMWNAPTRGLMHGVRQSMVPHIYYISVLISNI